MLNLILNNFPDAMQIKLFGRKILQMPSFHLELAELRGWPIGVDIQWAGSSMHFVCEQCSSLL